MESYQAGVTYGMVGGKMQCEFFVYDGDTITGFTGDKTFVGESSFRCRKINGKVYLVQWEGMGPVEQFKNMNEFLKWYNSLPKYDGECELPNRE